MLTVKVLLIRHCWLTNFDPVHFKSEFIDSTFLVVINIIVLTHVITASADSVQNLSYASTKVS